MFRSFANHDDATTAAEHLAVAADFFDGCSHLHTSCHGETKTDFYEVDSAVKTYT